MSVSFDLYLFLFLAQKYLFKNMCILNRFEANCGKSVIPFHANYLGSVLVYIFNN